MSLKIFHKGLHMIIAKSFPFYPAVLNYSALSLSEMRYLAQARLARHFIY